MRFLRNTWYMAAWSEEVRRGLLPRTILDEHIVFYRKEDGQPVAIADTCPHRFVPLSKGVLKGDVVECGYHGLQFDCSGQCVSNPHGNRAIAPAMRVRRYPLVDRDECIWIWMGDPDQADMSRVPTFQFFDRKDPGVRTMHNYVHARFGTEILADNLMDLSHAEFLHAGSFSSGYAEKSTMEVVEDGNTVRVSRLLQDIPLPPPFAPIYDCPGNVDQYQETRWMAPGIFEFRNDIAATGGDRYAGVCSLFNHMVTPETERTTHYFFSISRRHQLEPEFDQVYKNRQLRGVEDEDCDMLNAQQVRIGERDLMEMDPVLLQSDAAAVRVRRVLRRLLSAEAAISERRTP
jgi:phenylpropionate dioxygenase-like ring-hydroxylating dioxygenase large terminal subunit